MILGYTISGSDPTWAVSGLKLTVIIQELFAPAEVALQEFMKLSVGVDVHHGVIELVGWPESFGIPRRDLAEHTAAKRLAENLDHQIQVPTHHSNALLKRWFGQ